jgi:hypothetical protein
LEDGLLLLILEHLLLLRYLLSHLPLNALGSITQHAGVRFDIVGEEATCVLSLEVLLASHSKVILSLWSWSHHTNVSCLEWISIILRIVASITINH